MPELSCLDEAKSLMESLGSDNLIIQYNLAQVYSEAEQNDAALNILEPLKDSPLAASDDFWTVLGYRPRAD
ncbi:MAG: hypothetical protein R2880_03085 [Deinococcales bacterium]